MVVLDGDQLCIGALMAVNASPGSIPDAHIISSYDNRILDNLGLKLLLLKLNLLLIVAKGYIHIKKR